MFSKGCGAVWKYMFPKNAGITMRTSWRNVFTGVGQKVNGMIEIRVTEDYDRLVPFFIENGLEFSEDEPTPTDLVRCWAAEEEGRLVGGFVLAMRDGEYICDGIAVAPSYRGQDLGRTLLRVGMDEAIVRGGSRMYLVARAPGFFRREGFRAIEGENAPDFFECLTCEQYGVSCHPEVMVKDLA